MGVKRTIPFFGSFRALVREISVQFSLFFLVFEPGHHICNRPSAILINLALVFDHALNVVLARPRKVM